MRNYTLIDKYLDELIQDIYPQPQDAGHTGWAQESINYFSTYITDAHTVLDMGCGEAFCQPMFEEKGYAYLGVCLGEDYQSSLNQGRNVVEEDFTFSSFKDESFDLIYSRHSLEHSPVPLLTLKDWYRISKGYLALVLPSPVFWEYKGQNHYFVLNDKQWENLFDKVGFDVRYAYSKRQNMTTDPDRPEVEIEYWYLLEKHTQDESKEIG